MPLLEELAETNGIGLSDVTVTASINGNPITNGITDANGIFNLSGLLPGAYTLQAGCGRYILPSGYASG